MRSRTGWLILLALSNARETVETDTPQDFAMSFRVTMIHHAFLPHGWGFVHMY